RMFSTMANPVADNPQYTRPSVIPAICRRRRHSNSSGAATLPISSITGATTTATSSSGSPASVNRYAAAVLTASAREVATNAPQAKQNTRYRAGSGSYRSSQRNANTSTGTGMIAAAKPISSASSPYRQPITPRMITAQIAITRPDSTSGSARRRGDRRGGRGYGAGGGAAANGSGWWLTFHRVPVRRLAGWRAS